MVDNGLLGLSTGNDELFVYNSTNATQLPLGAVNMGRGDYVAGLLGGQINFGASRHRLDDGDERQHGDDHPRHLRRRRHPGRADHRGGHRDDGLDPGRRRPTTAPAT